jgi:membrane protein DedA with SNARE-associated domain
MPWRRKGKSTRMDTLTPLLAEHGLALVFANVWLAQAGLPLPAVPLLVVAGALGMQGQISLTGLLAVAVIASLIGDIPWYWAGRRYGHRVLRTLCRVAVEPDSCVKQTETIFERWGGKSLMVAKFVPGFSTIAPPLAGATRLAFPRFVAYSTAGAAAWAGVAVAAGAVFHVEIDWLLARLEAMGIRTFFIFTAIVAIYIGIKAFERYMLIRFLRMVRITIDELQQLLAQEVKPVILDVRSAVARQLDPRHIPGSIAVDMTAPERHLAAIAPDRDVVVYCS